MLRDILSLITILIMIIIPLEPKVTLAQTLKGRRFQILCQSINVGYGFSIRSYCSGSNMELMELKYSWGCYD